ncbi:MAG TPA: acyl-CoA dehydrogenase family protein [Phenylobacterium sp.]|uniref:acyl-CoA dehydrogenase family protein n=1 Tax=Phenylobacterium sp. TaxID=1871053 RepID=UPI002B46A38B|nr:acyl-CoA dehydrogenase family protein [Phenylobacterium sp.]HKR87441.1 acyl-CoA dehydrogenase family protein [Phenylobacterium sp.]
MYRHSRWGAHGASLRLTTVRGWATVGAGATRWYTAGMVEMDAASWEEDLVALSEGISDVLEAECDRRAVHAFFDGQNDLDQQLWARAAELGWLGLGLPEDYGGLGLGAPGLDVLYRALGAALAPGAFIPTLAVAQWLSGTAADSVKEEVLPQVATGALTLAAPASLEAEPLPVGDGLLRGVSQPMLGTSRAALAIAPVRVDGRNGFAVVRLDGARAKFEAADTWDRTRSIGRIVYDRAEPLALLADADGALNSSLRSNLALAVAGDSVGGARAIAEQTIAYMKERVQFGRPIASFQALKHRAADLMVAVIQGEQALDQAVAAAADGEPNAAMWASLAKVAAAEHFRFVADDCVQLHGGVGFTWEFDCHIFLKRALLNRELAGSAGALRDLAATYLAAASRAGRTTAELTT